MLVTFPGIDIEGSLQKANAFASIVVTLSGIVIDVNEVAA